MTQTPLTAEQAAAIEDWLLEATPSEKKETFQFFSAAWKALKGSDEEAWKVKSVEQKLEVVEKFVIVVVGLLLGPFKIPVGLAIASVNALQKWYFKTSAKERTATKLYDWLSKRKKLNNNQRKVAFIFGIWIGLGNIAPAAHGLMSETVGRGFDHFGTPWQDFLSIWGWGADTAEEPKEFKGRGHGSRAPDWTPPSPAAGLVPILLTAAALYAYVK